MIQPCSENPQAVPPDLWPSLRNCATTCVVIATQIVAMPTGPQVALEVFRAGGMAPALGSARFCLGHKFSQDGA